MSDDGSSVELEPYETQFVPKENDDNELWDVIAIVAERPQQFKVKWKGIDPATRKPWKDSWVSKEDCTDDLIREWKVKQAKKKAGKSGTTKGRASTTSSRTNKGAASPAIVKTRRTRQSATKASTSSTATSRPVSNASGSRSNPPNIFLSPRKRRRTTTNEEVKLNAAHPSRPAKKRKIDVEVVRPTSPELQSDRDVVTRKGVGKRAAIGGGDDEKRNLTRDRNTVINGGGISSKAAGKRKMEPAELEESSDEDRWSPVVPIKVGPPRGAKRRRDGESTGTRHARRPSADRQTLRDHDLPRAQTGGGARPVSPHSKDGMSARQKDTASSHPARRPIKLPSRDFGAHNGLVDSPRSARGAHSETDDSVSDHGHPRTSRLKKDIVMAKAQPLPQSPRSRQFLMQEEEENTQEAAGLVPVPSDGVSDPLHVTEIREADERNGVGPFKLVVRRGRPQRPQANDTFSRDGIVPETQTTGAPDVLDEPLYDPTQHDLNPADPPSTPVRPAPIGRRAPGSASSVVSKMKNKGRNQGKGLRPIHCLTPPDFRPYLQSSQFDDIEDFSSPEKDSRGKGRPTGPLTQDTIEEADFSQDFDQFVDWNGGAQYEQPSTSLPSNGPALSLGPDLPPPNHDGGQRRKSDLLLSKRPERPVPQPLLLPTIPLPSEPPPTSTTQRADADSQSLYHPVLNGQIAELTMALEDREEKLSQLEGQIEELQERIVELEQGQGSMKEYSAFEAELKALREISDEKSDQISLLESQLVELQLQLTQLTDIDNLESQIRQLNESLEDRDEQVSQLEAALVELQTEIETLQAANEKLTETVQQHGPREKSTDVPQAAVQRLVSLDAELASTREQLSELARARDEAVSRANLLETASREWERRLKDAEDDRVLYKKVFAEASTHAQRLAQENIGLEERAQRAEGQVQEGLAMVRGTFTQQVKTLQAEVDKWQGLCKVLTDRDARTNDEIRSRAAQEPGLREENARLRVEAQIAHRETEELRTIVERLSSNRRKATDSEDDDDDDEEFVPDPDESASSSNSASSPSPGKDASRAASSPEVRSRSSDDGLYYLCEYASGPHGCNAWFLSALDVIEHANEAHYKDAAL